MSLEITTFPKISSTSRLLQRLLRPLRPRLAKPTPFPQDTEFTESGSPRLSPPSRFLLKLWGVDAVVEERVCDVYTYEFVLEAPVGWRDERTEKQQIEREKRGSGNTGERETRKRRRRGKEMYYFHGGSFQAPPSLAHWWFCCKMARVSGVQRVVLVSYPVAPRVTAKAGLAVVEAFLKDILRLDEALDKSLRSGDGEDQGKEEKSMRYKEENMENMGNREGENLKEEEKEVVLAGDSSGANIILSSTLSLLSRFETESNNNSSTLAGRKPKVKLSLLLISPPLDLRHTNPAQHEADQRDPVMSLEFVGQMAWEPTS